MALTLALPDPLDVTIAFFHEGKLEERTYRVMPATREQVRRALALDPTGEDVPSALTMEGLRAKQAEILAERSGRLKVVQGEEQTDWSERIPFGEITGTQAGELSSALLHYHLGQDPVQALAISRVLKKNGVRKMLAAAAKRSTAKPSPSPSTSAP